MKSFKFFNIGLICLICGCGVQTKMKQSGNNIQSKVLSVKEYSYVYEIKGLDLNSNDTIFILSYKENYFDKHHSSTPINLEKANKIELNKDYTFKSVRIKPQVSHMQQLGAYIIVENDTLYKSRDSFTIPPYYASFNSLGMLIE